MSPPTAGFSFPVNLIELCMSVWTLYLKAKDTYKDLVVNEDAFARQRRRSQALGSLLQGDSSHTAIDLTRMPVEQRIGIMRSLRVVEAIWQEFSTIFGKYQQASSLQRNTSLPIKWISVHGSRVEKLLQQLEKANTEIKEEIDMFVEWYGKVDSNITTQIEANASAQLLEISTSSELRKTWNIRWPGNRELLKNIEDIEPSGPREKQKGVLLWQAKYGNSFNILVEHRYYQKYDANVEARAIQLASFLNIRKSKDMRVAQCIGTYHSKKTSSYGFFFGIRDLESTISSIGGSSGNGSSPALPNFVHLRSALDKPGGQNVDLLGNVVKQGGHASLHAFKFGSPSKDASLICLSITKRFQLASSIARTVYETLLVGWVHQNIRSDSIWLDVTQKEVVGRSPIGIEIKYKELELGIPYLFNFEYARAENEYSDPQRVIPSRKKDNMYRHPHRQNARGVEPHDKIHDIYSLGIVLLEIGMGRVIEDFHRYLDSIKVDDHSLENVSEDLKEAYKFREEIVQGASIFLPEKMGERYTKLVVRCLTGDLMPSDDIIEEERSLCVMRGFRKLVVEELASLQL